jgi:hypothetical protein
MVLGAKHVESPYIEFGQIATVIYFANFLIAIPLSSLLENSLVNLAKVNHSNSLLSIPSNNNTLLGLSYNKPDGYFLPITRRTYLEVNKGIHFRNVHSFSVSCS